MQVECPKGWIQLRLGKFAKVITGGTPSRSVEAYWGGPIPWVATGEIDFNTIASTRERITAEGLRNSSARLCPAGTLIMAMFGQGVTRGRVAILGVDATFNQACSAIIPHDGTSTRYLFHYLAFYYLHIRLLGQAGTQSNLNAALIRSIPVNLPPKPVQGRIAYLADSHDSDIAHVRSLLAAKEKLKRGLMQQLLTARRRFPEFTEPWCEHRLGNLVTPATRRNTNGVARVLSATGRHGLVDQRDYFNSSVAGEDLSGYYLLRRGEFAYNRSAMKGYPYGAIKRLDDFDEGVLSTLYMCFALASNAADTDFLSHLFEAGVLNRQLQRIAHISARAHGLLNITNGDFYGLRLRLPELPEQRRIAAVLNTADAEIDLLRRQLEALRAQKKGLMRKLLTGQIRVNTKGA